MNRTASRLDNIARSKILARLQFYYYFFALLIFAVPAGAATTITLEAESGNLTAPMVIQSDPAASGGRFVEVPQGTGDNTNDATNGGPGQANFSINVPEAGTYFLWARTLASTARGEKRSFYVTGNGTRIRKWLVPRSPIWK